MNKRTFSRVLTVIMSVLAGILGLLLLTTACKQYRPDNNPVTPGSDPGLNMETDKACYMPGDQVLFKLNKLPPANTMVRIKRLNYTVAEMSLNTSSWNWTAPPQDRTGYLACLYTRADGQEKILASIGIDVSSDWQYYPRYGFLSDFGKLSHDEMNKIVNRLNRFHINGVQFQDWEYKHHRPLAGSVSNPLSQWKDIANRDTYLSTVQYFISRLHAHHMKAMSYNLAFGALSDAAADGVQEEWYLFKDRLHQIRDKHSLPKPPFKSDIFLTNPANTNWQQYLIARNKELYDVFGFDGYHIDQLGDRGQLYDYSGNPVQLASTFSPFINAMKNAAKEKRLVMNAVNQFGQETIATAPVDFLYTEVWSPHDRYEDLATIIQQNNSYHTPAKQSVLAAYLNYDLADQPGYFNTPGVLLADAVIFSFGGAHLELGEHLLGKEYFPNNNLQMKEELQSTLVNYYDFLVAYQNLLRDGGQLHPAELTCTNQAAILTAWPPVKGKVSVAAKLFNNGDASDKQVIHLINFTNASDLAWRDNYGKQPEPATIRDATLRMVAEKKVSAIWYASPDFNKGVPSSLPFTQVNGRLNFTLPFLKYWDMIVIEYS